MTIKINVPKKVWAILLNNYELDQPCRIISAEKITKRKVDEER